MNRKSNYLFVVSWLLIGLTWQARAVTPETSGTALTDQQLDKDIQALNGTLKKEVQVEKQLLQQSGSSQQSTGMLNLGAFQNTPSTTNQGVYNTFGQPIQNAFGGNGVTSSGQGYSGQGTTPGIYTVTPQQYSQQYPQYQQVSPVIANQSGAQQFQTTQPIYNNSQMGQKYYEKQLKSLEEQLLAANNKLKNATTQTEALKYQAEVNAINVQISALAAYVNPQTQNLQLQQAPNSVQQQRQISPGSYSYSSPGTSFGQPQMNRSKKHSKDKD